MMITDFGTTTTGQLVHQITLRNADLTVTLLTLGAIVHSVHLRGIPHSLTLGSDNLRDYEGAMQYHGALIAPVVNRITHATAPLGDQMLQFEPNEGGRTTLHSGKTGAHRQIWQVTDQSDTTATMALTLADGAGGFPGTRPVRVTFTLDGATLRMQITATTDRPTLFNAANHSFWNLDGTASWVGHSLWIDAAHHLAVHDDLTPTGDILPIIGTPYDFRTPRTLTPGAPPLDTNFCLSDRQRPLTEVLTLTGRDGTAMTVSTTEPGVQVYDDRGPYHGLAIEPQGWPDAPNHPGSPDGKGFPPITLNPGETYRQITEWRFTTP